MVNKMSFSSFNHLKIEIKEFFLIKLSALYDIVHSLFLLDNHNGEQPEDNRRRKQSN